MVKLRILVASLCIATVAVTAESNTRRRMRELAEQIKREIGVPRAERVEQCRAIAFGAKPCGGPWRYLVYSTAVTDSARLEKLVDEHRKLEEKANREDGGASDCAMVMPPEVVLADGVCRAR